MVEIERAEVDGLVAVQEGNRTFRELLQQDLRGHHLFNVLANYVAFNSTFGAGVANLAGEVGCRKDLFRDPTEEIAALADRSMEVGADVIYAATDEFDDRSTPHKDTHRTLAMATLKGTAKYMGLSYHEFNTLATPTQITEDALPKVRHGYGLNRVLDDRALFQAMGFHMASEILADEEFCLMDAFFRSRHPDLVAFLEQERVSINGEEHQAYWWVHIHTSVEADHFEFAVRGANSALRYYAGKESVSTLKGWILDGFAEFSSVQSDFMRGLTSLADCFVAPCDSDR